MNKLFIYSIILMLFFEGKGFSFYLFGARIRVIQIFGSIGFLLLLIGTFTGKIHLKKTNIDFPLWSYIGINFVAICFSIDPARSTKIVLLLLSNALLYYLVVALITTRKLFDNSFILLLYIGMAQIIYGLYQTGAGMLNYFLGMKLPIGYLDVVHTNYIGAPWGRPYGTFVEPDWYGTICMFYALLFLILYYSKLRRTKFYFIGLLVSLAGLLVSFVRAAWLGFFIGLIFLLILRNKSKLLRYNSAILTRNIFILFSCLLLLLLLSQSFRTVLKERFYPLDKTARFYTLNIRFVAMKESFNSFLKSPIIGLGPGSVGKTLEFNPSIVTTVLENTGIAGFALFILLIGKLFIYNLKKIPSLDEKYQLTSLSLLIGLIGLLTSYIFTNGFWIPFTWIFFAYNITALKMGILAKV